MLNAYDGYFEVDILIAHSTVFF